MVCYISLIWCLCSTCCAYDPFHVVSMMNTWSKINFYLILGWQWSILQDQKKHPTEEAYECILWSAICGVEFNCLLIWWSPPPRRTDSWWGLPLALAFFFILGNVFNQTHVITLLCFMCIASAGNGGWGWNRRDAAPNWWRSPVSLVCCCWLMWKFNT